MEKVQVKTGYILMWGTYASCLCSFTPFGITQNYMYKTKDGDFEKMHTDILMGNTPLKWMCYLLLVVIGQMGYISWMNKQKNNRRTKYWENSVPKYIQIHHFEFYGENVIPSLCQLQVFSDQFCSWGPTMEEQWQKLGNLITTIIKFAPDKQ